MWYFIYRIAAARPEASTPQIIIIEENQRLVISIHAHSYPSLLLFYKWKVLLTFCYFSTETKIREYPFSLLIYSKCIPSLSTIYPVIAPLNLITLH